MLTISALDVPPAASMVIAMVLAVVSKVPGMETLSWVALVGVTSMAVPSKRTLTGAMKLLPVSVSDCVVLLALRDVGVVEMSVGGAGVMVTDLLFEVPPAACTETLSEPAAVNRLAGSVTCAKVSVDALVANVCVPVAPDTTTATGGLKLLPVRVKVLAVARIQFP